MVDMVKGCLPLEEKLKSQGEANISPNAEVGGESGQLGGVSDKAGSNGNNPSAANASFPGNTSSH